MKRPRVRPRRALLACVLAGLLHAAGSCRTAAQEPARDQAGCVPLTAAGIEAVGNRLSLDADQREWLGTRLTADSLREPEDLEALPGLGGELRDALVSTFCWGVVREGEVELSSRTRPEGARNEARARIGQGASEGSFRMRWDSWGNPTGRGGIEARTGRWAVVLGTIKARRGMGLLLASPGAEPRSGSPVEPARGGWRPSLSIDPGVLAGGAVSWCGTPRVEAALVRGPVRGPSGEDAAAWWGSLEAGYGNDRSGIGLLQLVAKDAWSVSLHAEGAAGPGRWAGEWAESGGGNAQAAAWSLRHGDWRFRLSGSRVGGGYRTPTVRWRREAAESEAGALHAEVRWLGSPGRFLRAAWSDVREPGGWVRITSRFDVEAGETLRPGVRLVLLWRGRLERDMGEPDPDDEERLLRGDLLVRRRSWKATLRIEERRYLDGRSGLTLFRLGHGTRRTWEIRAVQVILRGPVPRVWLYGRRAGGVHGWDRVESGTWIGGWVRWPLGRWAFEVSGDARGERWDLVGALRIGMG